MNIKPHPNHKQYLEVLRKMTPQQRLKRAFELSAEVRQLFFHGLKKTFPEKSEAEIRDLYLRRIAKCYNRNW